MDLDPVNSFVFLLSPLARLHHKTSVHLRFVHHKTLEVCFEALFIHLYRASVVSSLIP
jgi:hypothetical protein